MNLPAGLLALALSSRFKGHGEGHHRHGELDLLGAFGAAGMQAETHGKEGRHHPERNRPSHLEPPRHAFLLGSPLAGGGPGNLGAAPEAVKGLVAEGS